MLLFMSSGWSSDFSYNYFKKILEVAKDTFQFHLLCDAPHVINDVDNSRIFLRHDIDIDLNKALKMAEIEQRFGICSTYMVMLNSPTYDIEISQSKTILQQLMAMGHEVALHFDLEQIKRNQEISIDSIESEIRQDIKRLENIILQPVQSISFHRPLAQFLRGPLQIANVVNAYAKELMSWYLSDSAGNWREGEPLQKLKNPNGNLLQLLIHPIWWGEEHKSGSENLEDFFQKVTHGWTPKKIRSFDEGLGSHIGVKRSGAKIMEHPIHVAETGKFNTNSTALITRIEAHERFGKNDLNNWIFQNLHIERGNSILDLGCGTGKQTIPAAGLCGEHGTVVAFDTSQESLATLKEMAKQLKIDHCIEPMCGDLDELEYYINGKSFDRVIGSFSVYYAKDPQKLFQSVHKHLNEGGIFFLCGPAKENNDELKKFHNKLLKQDAVKDSISSKFMEVTAKQLAKKIFSKVEYFTFENALQFDSAENLYNYWSSYNLYDERVDASFRRAAVLYFETNPVFVTIKRVIGIKVVN